MLYCGVQKEERGAVPVGTVLLEVQGKLCSSSGHAQEQPPHVQSMRKWDSVGKSGCVSSCKYWLFC